MSKEMREDLGLATPAKEPATIATSPTTTIPAPPPTPPAVANESGKPKPKGSKKRRPVPPSFLPETPDTSRTNSVSAEPAQLAAGEANQSAHEQPTANGPEAAVRASEQLLSVDAAEAGRRLAVRLLSEGQGAEELLASMAETEQQLQQARAALEEKLVEHTEDPLAAARAEPAAVAQQRGGGGGGGGGGGCSFSARPASAAAAPPAASAAAPAPTEVSDLGKFSLPVACAMLTAAALLGAALIAFRTRRR